MPKGKGGPKHTHFVYGHRVIVKLKDGRQVVDNFVKRTGKKVELKKLGHVWLEDILTISKGFKHLKKENKE